MYTHDRGTLEGYRKLILRGRGILGGRGREGEGGRGRGGGREGGREKG